MTAGRPSKYDPALVSGLVRYNPDTGKLFWRERSSDMFASERAAKIWNTKFAGKEAFTSCNDSGYKVGAIMNKTYRAHHVAWAATFGAWPSMELDHINGDRTDNRICNLRDVSRSVNKQNSKIQSNNTSGHVGVCWSKAHSLWLARISNNGKVLQLGMFKDLGAAISARKAAEKRFGYTERHGSAA